VIVETKGQSKQWMHTFTKQSRKRTLSVCKKADAIFWARNKVLMEEFTQQGTQQRQNCIAKQ
jgi:hypothetical protein